MSTSTTSESSMGSQSMYAPLTTSNSVFFRTLAALLVGASLLAAVAIEATEARADDLIIKYDQSQLLRMPRPVAEIIIGNPSIADVTVQSSKLLVITGKSFGITNIITLDAERNVIRDQRVLVQRDVVKIVNLQRGIKRQSYNCSPQCNPTITVGDDTEYFGKVAANSERKIKLSEQPSAGVQGGAR